MYKIGICDDEISVCAEIEQYIKRYCKIHFLNIETAVFYSGDKLCNYLEFEDNLELIFLDIEIPNKNGILVGQYIREEAKDEKIDIVYISSKENYAIQLFKNRPLDFLVKPMRYNQIEKVLDVFIKRKGIQERMFECVVDRVHKRIVLSDILYLASNDKKITIHTTANKKITFYGKLGDAFEKLPKSMFLSIHKSYIINCDYVKEYTYEWIKLTNNEVLEISKSNRKQVRRCLLEYETED